MRFQVTLFTLLSISSGLATKPKNNDEPKDKREAPVGYHIGHPTLSYPQSLGQEEASAISIGAGYSVGGAKPSFAYGVQDPTLQINSENLPSSGHATIQLSPITLQAGHGGLVHSADLSQLMSQVTQGLNSGAISLQGHPGLGGGYHFDSQGVLGGEQQALQQLTSYGGPKLQEFNPQEQGYTAVPSYAAGTKGLGSYSSTGPVLFSPAEQIPQHSISYAGRAPAHPLNLYGLGNTPHSGYNFGSQIKGASSNYPHPQKGYFKPSAYLGSSGQKDSHQGPSAVAGSHSVPSSYDSNAYSSGHLSSLGGSLGNFGASSSKMFSNTFLSSKPSGLGLSLEPVVAFSSGGQGAAPPGTTYGVPGSWYPYPTNGAHTASSNSHYYLSPKYPSQQPGQNSFKPGPKYNTYGSDPRVRHGPPRDIQGAHSENMYNTIKYSEELKPQH